MQKCVLCGADTVLYVNGVPVCTECDDKRERGELPQRPEKSDEQPA